MPRAGDKKALPESAQDPEGLYVWGKRYFQWLRVQNYSEATVDGYEVTFVLFMEWAERHGITRPVEVTKPILERYQRHLFHYRKPSGKPLGFSSQGQRLIVLRGYFRWLCQQNVLLSNPASEISLPKRERRLPRDVLNEVEMELVLCQPDVSDALGVRDRAILEVLYSTGMRRMELAGLSVYDIDQERGTAFVRGKGKRERVVPVGQRALMWVERYLSKVRPELVLLPDSGALFLTQYGEGFQLETLSHAVKRYVKQSGVGKRGACHMFRHTMATLMLERGADVRVIQEILGHAQLNTTQLYTHVSIKRLKAVHELTHPGAHLAGPTVAKTKRGEESSQSEGKPTTAELLKILEYEAANESE